MSNWVTSFVPGTLRNNYPYPVGIYFKVGSKDVFVKELGRMAVAGNVDQHLLKLIDADTGVDISGGSVISIPSLVTPGTFAYTPLLVPIVLPANSEYYLVSQEDNGGDQWYNNDASIQTTSVIRPIDSVYYSGTIWIRGGNNPGATFVGLDIIYADPKKPFRKSIDYTYNIKSKIPDAAQEAIISASTQLTRRVEIYEQDGLTLWNKTPAVLDGSVSVDMTRSEKRSFQLTLDNTEREFRHEPGELWYDKIIRPIRGVQWEKDGFMYKWETPLGDFMIDEITSQDFPHTVAVQGRDYTKKLINSKFKVATSFKPGFKVQDLLRNIAISGGISASKIIVSSVAIWNIGKDWLFDRGVDRWKAMSDIASNYSIEIYFDAYGNLIIRDYQDPVHTPSSFIFKTGSDGNLVHYQKSSRDTRIYNSITVSGESTNTTPIYGLAANHTPGSPTRIEEIGERVFEYTSAFIVTQAQANAVALRLLSQHALEEYDVNLEAIGAFWLDAGNIITFLDPDPNANDPTSFLLSAFEIPLTLGSMSYSAKRVIRVEDFTIELQDDAWRRAG